MKPRHLSLHSRRARLVGVVAALFAASALLAGCEKEQREDQKPTEANAQQSEVVSLTMAMTKPNQYAGRKVSGEVSVADVVSDRGFWVTDDNDDRVFAVINEAPGQEKVDINSGQNLQMTATLMRGSDADKLPGTLDQQTKDILSNQDYFLSVGYQDVQIMEQPKAQASANENKTLQVGANTYGSFADYDTNGDQKLSDKELSQGLKDQQYFSTWDPDSDNTLDKKEFRSNMRDLANTNQNEVVEAQEYQVFTDTFGNDNINFLQFNTLDVDNDGTLDTTEFDAAIARSGMFAQWNPGDDDVIDYNDYGADLVSVWDTDGDGFVEVQEFGFPPITAQVSQR